MNLKRGLSVIIGLLVAFLVVVSPLPVAAQIDIDVSRMSWDFGNVELSSSRTQIFTISSLDISMLTVYLSEISPDTISTALCGLGGLTCDFAFSGGPSHYPLNVPAGTSCDASVTFTPSSLGLQEAYLWILNNSMQQDLLLLLSGQGKPTSAVPEPLPCSLLALG